MPIASFSHVAFIGSSSFIDSSFGSSSVLVIVSSAFIASSFLVGIVPEIGLISFSSSFPFIY